MYGTIPSPAGFEKAKALPNVTCTFAAAPHCGWLERGLTIWGSDRAAITCHYNPSDATEAEFTSWNHAGFNYIANAKWDDWVNLAKAILSADRVMRPAKPRRSKKKK